MPKSNIQQMTPERDATADGHSDKLGTTGTWAGQIFAGDWVVTGGSNQLLPNLTLFDSAKPDWMSEQAVLRAGRANEQTKPSERSWQISSLQHLKPEVAALVQSSVSPYTVDSALATLATDISQILGASDANNSPPEDRRNGS